MQLISVNINLLEDALADGQEFQMLPKPNDWSNELMDAGIYQSLNQTDPINDLVKKELTQKRLRSYLAENELISSLTNLYRSSRLSNIRGIDTAIKRGFAKDDGGRIVIKD